MTIESSLVDLLKAFGVSDSEKKYNPAQLDKAELLRLDINLAKLINHYLLIDGPENQKIEKNYKILTLYFHPDRRHHFLPEVIWIEHQLSVGLDDGVCFKRLHACYDKLVNPQKFKKDITFADISSRGDCIQWLLNFKERSTANSEKSLCDSLLQLLEHSGDFFDRVDMINSRVLRALIMFIPSLLATYGAVIVAEEVFALYFLYFVFLKSGQFLEQRDSAVLIKFGQALQEITLIAATSTTNLLTRLLDMTYWVSLQCFDTTVSIGSVILKPLLSDIEVNEENAEPSTMGLKTTEIQKISIPLTKYIKDNEKQFFGSIRLGSEKNIKVNALLFQFRALDSGNYSLAEKLNHAQKLLDDFKNNEIIYASTTRKAIDESVQILLSIKGESAPLALYAHNR
ncbi:MAG TPA: J domain-containing protein [Legionella sp.]|nr:J domain-containing protein [Legionella sp.]